MSSQTDRAAAPLVVVLLLNWNGWRDTVECLESLLRMDYPAARLRILLCDNASTDGSVERVFAWAAGEAVEHETPAALRHLVDPRVQKPVSAIEVSATGPADPHEPLWVMRNSGNLGFAGGNNAGLRYLFEHSRADYVWVLNNDIIVAPDALSRLVSTAQAIGTPAAIGATLFEYRLPKVVQIAGGGAFRSWQGAPRVRDRMPASSQPERIGYVSGGCMLAPLPMLRDVGLIDESYFMYGEDVDYSCRIREAGYALMYEPRAHVWHKGGAAVGRRSPRQDYYTVRNNLVLARRFHPVALPVATLYGLYRFLLPKVVRMQWDRLRAVVAGFRDFFRGVSGVMPTPPAR